MAKKEDEQEKQIKTTFTGLTLKSFTRKAEGTTANFSSNLTAALIKSQGWDDLKDYEKSVDLTGGLAAKTVTMNGAGTLSDVSVSIEAQSVGSFVGVRREIEGKKQKGFRHELHFVVKSADSKAGRHLETYLMSIPEGKGTMVVMHSATPPKQEGLGLEQTEEQRQATLAAND